MEIDKVSLYLKYDKSIVISYCDCMSLSTIFGNFSFKTDPGNASL